MLSKSLYIRVLFHTALIVLLSLGIAWSYWQYQNVWVSVILGILLILEIQVLIYDLNSTNRKLAFFFDAIQNDDTTLVFPEKTSGPALRSLHQSLNQVNSLIQRIRIQQNEQEQYFQTVMNEVDMGIVILEENGYISFSNHAARNLLTYQALSHVKQLEQVDSRLYYVMRDIQAGERHLISLKKAPYERRLVIKASPFKGGQRAVRLIAIQDIKGELDQHELDAWVRLIRVLIHEMVNTVTPISSLAETLGTHFPETSSIESTLTLSSEQVLQMQKGLSVIHERGRGLLAFIESYRKLTRLPHPQKKEVPLHALIDRMRILLSAWHSPPEMEWEVKLSPSDLRVWVDEELFSQVLLNVLKNAREAASGQPSVQIIIQAEVLAGDKVLIILTDNGPGIPLDLLEQIFVPFFTTREDGTGIGLSLSRQIIRMHGGQMGASSEPGRTQIWIQLPVQPKH